MTLCPCALPSNDSPDVSEMCSASSNSSEFNQSRSLAMRALEYDLEGAFLGSINATVCSM